MELIYADGWDKAVVNPLTADAAAARDAEGSPYSVILSNGARVHAVLDISWDDGYCGISRFDAKSRLVARHVLRQGRPGELFLRSAETWTGAPDAGEYEFPHVAAWHSTTYKPDGLRIDQDKADGDRGGLSVTQGHEPAPRVPVPPFGQWAEVLALAGVEAGDVAEAADHRLPVRTASEAPWEPPRSMSPGPVEDLFEAGAERAVGDRWMRLTTHPVGRLRLPSGRLVATDPSYLPDDSEPFAVSVMPGTYPVTISVATFTDDPGHHRVAAVRLEIAAQQVARWEMALKADQDPFDLDSEEFFGFGVDAGVACFVDASEVAALADAWRELGGLVAPRHAVVGDGRMVAWSSGWGDGSYPTWIGRAADGSVVCFVADMLLFDDDDEEEDDEDDD
ncbi:DUF4241 domain-containing protein [Asanoa sp. NPDC050611]|uniref:DUF4241 domain-containing protein n=1 Tax=Asanoa sp. NPDC050611 TaxID=3157098 RepID=UPI0033F40868